MTKRRMEIAVQAEQHSICNFWKCKIFINQNMSSIIYSSSFCWDIYGMYILRTQVRLLATQLTDLGPFSRLYPKGLRAESARAVTGRWCPHSAVGRGKTFWRVNRIFFYKTVITLHTFSERFISWLRRILNLRLQYIQNTSSIMVRYWIGFDWIYWRVLVSPLL